MSAEREPDTRRDARRCALQGLYERDAGGADLRREGDEAEPAGGATLAGWLGPEGERLAAGGARAEGERLAALAWEFREDADRAVAALSTEWSTHRQPVVDRNVLRLAWYEMTHGGVPAPVAINEAVELAREFGSERSAAFVNAILDGIHRGGRSA
ncbi:MAG: transcription antitermination factor NusB [Phycisphaerales bacterium]